MKKDYKKRSKKNHKMQVIPQEIPIKKKVPYSVRKWNIALKYTLRCINMDELHD